MGNIKKSNALIKAMDLNNTISESDINEFMNRAGFLGELGEIIINTKEQNKEVKKINLDNVAKLPLFLYFQMINEQ